MIGRTDQIGFSQRVRLEWLDQTANLVLAGNDKAAIYDTLQELLMDKISVGGHANRSNREKIITILMKIWLTSPMELESLRIKGLELLKRVPQHEHLVVHWGMVMAVYPFWSEVAIQVGRLLRLQGSAAASHVQRRMRERYGERETVSRASRRILRSYVDWGVLSETELIGVYTSCTPHDITDPQLITWLIEASLHAGSSDSAPLKELLISPCLFPFNIKPLRAESIIAASTNLEILHHGVDVDLVILGDPFKGKNKN